MGWRKVVTDWREELRNTVGVPYEFTMNQVVSIQAYMPRLDTQFSFLKLCFLKGEGNRTSISSERDVSRCANTP